MENSTLPASLVGYHVFTRRERAKPGTGHFRVYSSTRVWQQALVRCRIAADDGKKVRLVAEGNGNPEIDDKYHDTYRSSLAELPDSTTIRVEEIHGAGELTERIGIWHDTQIGD